MPVTSPTLETPFLTGEAGGSIVIGIPNVPTYLYLLPDERVLATFNRITTATMYARATTLVLDG